MLTRMGCSYQPAQPQNRRWKTRTELSAFGKSMRYMSYWLRVSQYHLLLTFGRPSILLLVEPNDLTLVVSLRKFDVQPHLSYSSPRYT